MRMGRREGGRREERREGTLSGFRG
jgi:hypothetical protein